MPELIRPPQLSEEVEGLVNLGGTSYPVVRLDRLLGLEGFQPTADSHLILIRTNALTCLFAVDRVLGVDHPPESALGPVADFITRGASVVAQYLTDGRAVHVLAPEILLEAPGRVLRVVA